MSLKQMIDDEIVRLLKQGLEPDAIYMDSRTYSELLYETDRALDYAHLMAGPSGTYGGIKILPLPSIIVTPRIKS